MVADAKDDAFRTLFEPHRRAIVAHCYRMLGSLQDAEELAQETFVRAWQKQDERTNVESTRAWLYAIATRACLDVLRKDRRRRTLPHLLAAVGDAPSEEPLWAQPAPDTLFDLDAPARPDARIAVKESVGLAFVTALQLLSAKQRAALLLVDVLGWRPEETAALLETTTVSVSSLLQRARKNVEQREPDASPPSPENEALLRRYITAWESGDLEAFTTLLAEDARLSMPPMRRFFVGRDAILSFLSEVMRAQPVRYRVLPTRANGGPAMAIYASPRAGAPFAAAAISLLSIRDHRVASITRFGEPALFSRFDLPATIADAP